MASAKTEQRRRLRAALIARDGNVCAFCGLEGAETWSRDARPPSNYLHVDRIVPGAKGGKYVLGNCRLLCPPCNLARGANDDEKSVRFANKATQHGYTIIPNVVLLDRSLSLVARGLYAMLTHYARQDESCYPGQERLADDLDCGIRKLRDATRELQAKGLVRSYQRGRGTTNIYVILDPRLTGQDRHQVPPTDQDRQDMPPRPASGADEDRHQVPPKEYAVNGDAEDTSSQPARAQGALLPGLEGSGRPGRQRGVDPQAVPDDFPDELSESLDSVFVILHRTATSLGQGREVSRAAIARALMIPSRRRKPHVETADAVERWLCYGKGRSKPCRDVVARWVDWLDDAADVPQGGALVAFSGGNNGRQPTAEERRQAQQAERLARIRAAEASGAA